MIDPFLDACGATGPLLLNTESPGVPGGETRAFDLPFALVGRDPRSDLRLAHPDVSDRHAYLQMVDGQVLCFDLGSRVGIFQGGKCQRLAYLEHDRPVRVGPYRVRLVGGDRDASAGPPDSPRPPLPLELSHRSVRVTRCDLPAGLALVGSAADCQIRLVDPSVSNYHCSLVHTPAGVWVVDLLGQGGVRVNGQEVGYAQLHEGDSVRVGHSVLRLLDRAAAITPGECVSTAVPRTPDPARDEPAPANDVRRHPAGVELAAVEPGGLNPAVAPSAELIERILGPVVSQVGQLQQQMAEEFHQTRAALLDTLATLHQEQTAVFRHELEQVRKISEELHALRADLERQARPQPERTWPAPVAARLGAASDLLPAVRPAAAPATSQKTERVNPVPSLRDLLTPPSGNGNGDRAQDATGFARIEPEGSLIRGHNEQAHAKLCVRIARLTKKREASPWERLLAMFPRATPEKKPT